MIVRLRGEERKYVAPPRDTACMLTLGLRLILVGIRGELRLQQHVVGVSEARCA